MSTETQGSRTTAWALIPSYNEEGGVNKITIVETSKWVDKEEGRRDRIMYLHPFDDGMREKRSAHPIGYMASHPADTYEIDLIGLYRTEQEAKDMRRDWLIRATGYHYQESQRFLVMLDDISAETQG